MSAWLAPLRRALDEAREACVFFLRDDDAGWDDERLFLWLDLIDRCGLPADLALIPGALGPELAARLARRVAASGGRISLHQHGFRHLDHQSGGRKCEFGADRTAAAQRADIAEGQEHLRKLLGEMPQPIFTPPWNRCTAATGALLAELGFRALSQDLSAPSLGVPGLVELPIAVDWFARRKGVRLGRPEFGELLAAQVRTQAHTGIMFHHAQMDDAERNDALELLRLLAEHPRSRCRSMIELIDDAAGYALDRAREAAVKKGPANAAMRNDRSVSS